MNNEISMESPRSLLRSSSMSAANNAVGGSSSSYDNDQSYVQLQAQLSKQTLQYQALKEEFDIQKQHLTNVLANTPHHDQQRQNNAKGHDTKDRETGNKSNANTTHTKNLPFQRSKYNYSLPAIRTTDTLSTPPKPSRSQGASSNLAVIVLSARANFDRRQAIRETWGRHHPHVFFVIGGPAGSQLMNNGADADVNDDMNRTAVTARLFEEQQQYEDLLDTIHPDTYRGLPYKLDFAITWIGQHEGMKHIQWLLKVDDDVVVRLNTLEYHILRNFNASSPSVIGRIEPNSKPAIDGKWAEDPRMELATYPPWAYGSTGYVLSRPVMDYIASHPSLYYYQGEDVSLGLWLYESDLDVAWIDVPGFRVLKLWHDQQYSVVLGHDLSTEAMRNVFGSWKDPKPTSSGTLTRPSSNHDANQRGFVYYYQVGRLPDGEDELKGAEDILQDDDTNLQRSHDS